MYMMNLMTRLPNDLFIYAEIMQNPTQPVLYTANAMPTCGHELCYRVITCKGHRPGKMMELHGSQLIFHRESK